MKSARERARDAFGIFHSTGWTRQRMEVELARLFEEHARDQRHIVADRIAFVECDDGGKIAAVCHAAAMNAPAPGEDR